MSDSNIHIVYSSSDTALAEMVKEMLIKGSNISDSAVIFVDETQAIKKLVKAEIEYTISIILVTASFYENHFCMRNLGKYVAGFKSDIYPIVFQPVDYQDLRGMLIGVQVDNAEESPFLELADRIDDLGFNISVNQWDSASTEFKANYSLMSNAGKEWKQRDRYPNDPYITAYDEFHALKSTRDYGGYNGFAPYFLWWGLRNKAGLFVVDICRKGRFNFNPSSFIQMHEQRMKNTPYEGKLGTPLALLTIMIQKPGLRIPKKPTEIDSELKFYSYIDCSRPNWREYLLGEFDKMEIATLPE